VLEAILAGLAATTPPEAVSVALGLLYSLLAVKRIRWCWLAGGLGSGILVYLAWVAKLPMQAVLNGYYVAMSVYGFWHWSQDRGEVAQAVSTLPWQGHWAAIGGITLVSLLSSKFLAGHTEAAWPFLDSFVTWGSLFATWLVAQVKLENWLYWIVLDGISVFLYAAQGLMFVALLFAIYLVIASVGFVSWLRTWRARMQPT
jgi:nicotinamide mononucleotide transporter